MELVVKVFGGPWLLELRLVALTELELVVLVVIL